MPNSNKTLLDQARSRNEQKKSIMQTKSEERTETLSSIYNLVSSELRNSEDLRNFQVELFESRDCNEGRHTNYVLALHLPNKRRLYARIDFDISFFTTTPDEYDKPKLEHRDYSKEIVLESGTPYFQENTLYLSATYNSYSSTDAAVIDILGAILDIKNNPDGNHLFFNPDSNFDHIRYGGSTPTNKKLQVSRIIWPVIAIVAFYVAERLGWLTI